MSIEIANIKLCITKSNNKNVQFEYEFAKRKRLSK